MSLTRLLLIEDEPAIADNVLFALRTAHFDPLWCATGIDGLARVAESSDTRQEITNLGLTYHLLTDYTSFVAVDETPRPELAAARPAVQPLPIPQGVPAAAVTTGGTAGTTPEPAGFLLIMVSLFAILGVRNRYLQRLPPPQITPIGRIGPIRLMGSNRYENIPHPRPAPPIPPRCGRPRSRLLAGLPLVVRPDD